MDSRVLKVTKNTYFTLLTHTKQLLLLTFCDTAAETEVSIGTHERKWKRNGRTDKRGSRNSYLDIPLHKAQKSRLFEFEITPV